MTNVQQDEGKKEVDQEVISENEINDAQQNPKRGKHFSSSSSSLSTSNQNASTMVMEAETKAETNAPESLSESARRIPMDSLPPLPNPQHTIIRRETIGGASLVILLIVSMIGLTHGVALTVVRTVPPDSSAYVIFLALIYGEALLAIVCLLGILFVDPGFIHRSQETCYPLPKSVEDWVRSRLHHQADTSSCPPRQIGPSEGNKDVQQENDSLTMRDVAQPKEFYIAETISGRVYCTRCLVWRQPGINHYHCATCQRCCAYYDHHCPFFGRCIAGDKRLRSFLHIKRGGNYKFFMAILVVGVVGYLTTVTSLMYALSLRYGAQWIVPIGLVVILWITTRFTNRSPHRICESYRCFVVKLVEFIRAIAQQCLGVFRLNKNG